MYVYGIVTCNSAAVAKIGMADDPLQRLRELQTAVHVPLLLTHVCPCASRAEARKLEKALHKEMADSQCRGGGSEWFGAGTLSRMVRRGRGKQAEVNFPGCYQFERAMFMGTPQMVTILLIQDMQRKAANKRQRAAISGF